MKKFFVFKNGQIIGSQIGYTTYKGALKSLIGTNDWYEQLLPYQNYNAKTEISKDLQNTGFYKRSIDDTCWLFIRSKWLKEIWYPFVKEKYQIIEKEYKIDIMNE